MLIKTAKAAELDRLRRKRPFLSFAPGDLTDLLGRTAQDLFPALNHPPDWFFVEFPHLACIYRQNGENATIFIHPLLNRAETPMWVFRYVFIHEMIHLTILGRKVDGKMADHPPEFWEAEKQLSPDRGKFWDWLWWNYGAHLNIDRKEECIRVRRNWRKRMYDSVRELPEEFYIRA